MENEKTLERIITLQEILDVLMQHLRTWVLFVVFALCVGILVLFFRSPVYESTALLQVSTDSNAGAGLFAKIAGSGGESGDENQNGEVQTEKYILTSRAVLENVVKSLHLDIIAKPLYFPLIGQAYANHHTKYDALANVNKPALGMSRYNWGGGHITISQFEVPKELTHKQFILDYLGNNQYGLFYNGNLILKGLVGTSTSGFVNQQPITILVSALSANNGAHFTLVKRTVLAAVNDLKNQIVVTLPRATTNLLRISLKGQANQDLQNRLAAVIDSGVGLSIQMRIQKAKKVLSFLEAQAPEIKSHINQLNKSMDDTMPIGPQFTALSQEKSIQNVMYTNVLMNVQQYELEKASSLGKILLIRSPAEITPAAIFSAPMLLALSLLLGTMIGAIYIFCRHYVFGVVHSAEQIVRVTGLPLLSSLQQSQQQLQQGALFAKGRLNHLLLLSEKSGSDLTLEGFRSLKMNLLLNHFYGRANCAVIAITGPTPGVGKSFVSANLADQLSTMGKKVLLIDADIRRGSLWKYFFDSPPPKGLVNLFKDRNYDAVIRHTQHPDIHFISTGELHFKHVELLLKSRFKEILEELKPRYDFIIIDTAPVFAVSDALLICRHTDLNFSIFAYGMHNEKDIDIFMKKFETVNINLNGFIMNKMISPGLGYYKYGYQQHEYRVYGE